MSGSRVRLLAAALSVAAFLLAWFGFEPAGADCGDTASGWTCNGRADVLFIVAYVAVALLLVLLVWEIVSRVRALRRQNSGA